MDSIKPKDRAIAALERREPLPGLVPAWELQFQLSEELLGRDYIRGEVADKATGDELDRIVHHNAELMAEITERLDFSITPSVGWFPRELETLPVLKRLVGDRYLTAASSGGTYGIPNGKDMESFACFLHDKPEEAHAQCRKMVSNCLEHSRRQIEAGADLIASCTDYCFNNGPFLSPRMFREFVTPYLQQIVEGIRELGAYVVIHTDGDIMPILEDLLAGGPHALHSLDPMAGVDIAEVKHVAGDRVCLIGNVNCSMLQIGSEEDLRESARYCLTHAMPGGGYIFSSSNVAFKGMPLERFFIMHEERKRLGRYPLAETRRS